MLEAATRTIRAGAGERTRVIRTLTSSIPRTYRLIVEPAEGTGPVGGTVEVRGSRWVFPKPPVVMPLVRESTVSRRFWDTVFTVFVTPDRDALITVR